MAKGEGPFGLGIGDLIKVGGVILALAGFYFRTDEFMREQKNINKMFVEYIQNHDGWTSAMTGHQFILGKPNGVKRDDFNWGNNRGMMSTASAHASEK